MKILRALVGVVVGYLIYALASMLVVGMVTPREGPTAMFLGLTALLVIGGIAGFATSAIAGGMKRPAALILAGLVAMATVANLAMQLGAEPTWYKVGTLLLTTPVIVIMSFRTAE